MTEKEYKLPLVTIIYFDNNDILTISNIGGDDDGKVTDLDWKDD